MAKNPLRFLAVVLCDAKTAALAIGLTILTATSCSSFDKYSGEFRTMPEEGWDYEAPIDFSPKLNSDSVEGDLAVVIRHTNLYPYSNIYVELTVTDTVATRCDTFNIILADRYGNWQGRGIGTSFQVSDTVLHDAMFRRPSKIRLRHVMRDDVLPEIEQVGITFNVAD